MIEVRVAVIYCCFVGVFGTLSPHGSTHAVNDSTEVFTNGTAELDGVRNRAAVLPVASAKADKADGSKYKVLHNKDDFPSGYDGPVKYERGQFVVDVSSKPFEGYLVREKGGDLNVCITVDELRKLSVSFDHLDQLKLEFVETKRYMDIGVAYQGGTYLFACNEGTNTKRLGAIESTTREFRVKVPSVAHASLTAAHWTLKTDISYSSVTGTMITDLSEVIPFKFSVIKSAAKFSLFFEPGQLAVIDPGPDKAAIIGGSVGGILGLGLVVAIGFFAWRHVKKQKEKKKDVPKTAAVAETRGETGTDFESGNLEKPIEDRVKAATKKRKVSKNEPETSKDSKTSEIKSVVTQNKPKEKVPSKKEVDKPVSQGLKQEEDKKSVVEAKEDLKKEPDGVDVGVNQVDKKEAQTKDVCDTKKVPESKEQVVPNKQPKEGSGIKLEDIQLCVDVINKKVNSTADSAAVEASEKTSTNREPIKIEDIPPPSVRVVTAPIWNFTSRNSSKFARPPIPRSLPVDMGAPNPAFFQEGQGTAYQDAVEAVRKEQEEAEKRAEEMRAYEEHEAKRPSIYRTKYLVGPDPLGSPLYKSEEDDTVFKTPKRKRKKRSDP